MTFDPRTGISGDAALSTLAEQWRSDAHVLQRRGAGVQAVVLEGCADELDSALSAWQNEALTLKLAAEESGYTEESLRRMVREGTLPAQRNSGRRSHIRVRRSDLPKKPRQRPHTPKREQSYNVDEDARDIAQRLGGLHA